MIYLLAKKTQDSLELRGVFREQSKAESKVVSDNWVIIPIEEGDLYGSDIVSLGMSGAYSFKGSTDKINLSVQSLATEVQNLSQQISNLSLQVQSNYNDLDLRIQKLEGV